MELQDLLGFIEQYGYFALFFSLWLGIIGMPLPDEMIVMSGGFLSSLEKMVVWKSFLLTYLGVISGLSLGYFLGKIFGHRVLDKLIKKNKAKYLVKSKELLNKYGRFALVLSYFIPIVRHILPYLVGMNNMPFKTYALFSYTTGFVWTLMYFTLGLLFGSQMEVISMLATKYGIYFGIISVIISSFYYFYIRKLKK
ncbi:MULTISPECIES: DedA family protein [Lysinibacillus]|uniref:Alkaline phosphatase n=1 Tax=Lysinibacillus fusiformis TaxID=28031 RepID=A0A2I0V3Z8_9BACI|nr:DedA family protein [Lysinibacillus fusiformis]MEE3807288.1 DedA family protein [Lysinibacillus fusiformis]PKU53031.1 alkaline phosphatase [Lysinibacillus fusiformis]